MSGITFLIEQFWGRAVQASRDSNRVRGAFKFLAEDVPFRWTSWQNYRRPVDRIILYRKQSLVSLIKRELGDLGPQANF